MANISLPLLFAIMKLKKWLMKIKTVILIFWGLNAKANTVEYHSKYQMWSLWSSFWPIFSQDFKRAISTKNLCFNSSGKLPKLSNYLRNSLLTFFETFFVGKMSITKPIHYNITLSSDQWWQGRWHNFFLYSIFCSDL